MSRTSYFVLCTLNRGRHFTARGGQARTSRRRRPYFVARTLYLYRGRPGDVATLAPSRSCKNVSRYEIQYEYGVRK